MKYLTVTAQDQQIVERTNLASTYLKYVHTVPIAQLYGPFQVSPAPACQFVNRLSKPILFLRTYTVHTKFVAQW